MPGPFVVTTALPFPDPPGGSLTPADVMVQYSNAQQLQGYFNGISIDEVHETITAASIKKSARPKISEDLEQDQLRELFNIPAPPGRRSGEQHRAFIDAQGIKLTNKYTPTDSNCLYGIEVEVENILYINPNIPLCWWQIKEDGSLRNNGREFVSHPLPQWATPYALTQLFDGLNKDCDFSHRTSVHIHQDIRALTITQLLTLLLTYIAVENLLFKFAGTHRRRGIYCIPLTETRLLDSIQSTKSFYDTLRNAEHIWSKYSAFNIIPAISQGTIEYRHLPGMANTTKILAWIDLLSKLKIWAYKVPYQVAIEKISALNTNSQYRQFLVEVFDDYASLLDLSSLLPDMETNVWWVKNCVLANEFHRSLEFSWESPFVKILGYVDPATELSATKWALWERFRTNHFPREHHIYLYNKVKNNLNTYIRAVSPEGQALIREIFNLKKEVKQK